MIAYKSTRQSLGFARFGEDIDYYEDYEEEYNYPEPKLASEKKTTLKLPEKTTKCIPGWKPPVFPPPLGGGRGWTPPGGYSGPGIEYPGPGIDNRGPIKIPKPPGGYRPEPYRPGDHPTFTWAPRPPGFLPTDSPSHLGEPSHPGRPSHQPGGPSHQPSGPSHQPGGPSHHPGLRDHLPPKHPVGPPGHQHSSQDPWDQPTHHLPPGQKPSQVDHTESAREGHPAGRGEPGERGPSGSRGETGGKGHPGSPGIPGAPGKPGYPIAGGTHPDERSPGHHRPSHDRHERPGYPKPPGGRDERPEYSKPPDHKDERPGYPKPGQIRYPDQGSFGNRPDYPIKVPGHSSAGKQPNRPGYLPHPSQPDRVPKPIPKPKPTYPKPSSKIPSHGSTTDEYYEEMSTEPGETHSIQTGPPNGTYLPPQGPELTRSTALTFETMILDLCPCQKCNNRETGTRCRCNGKDYCSDEECFENNPEGTPPPGQELTTIIIDICPCGLCNGLCTCVRNPSAYQLPHNCVNNQPPKPGIILDQCPCRLCSGNCRCEKENRDVCTDEKCWEFNPFEITRLYPPEDDLTTVKIQPGFAGGAIIKPVGESEHHILDVCPCRRCGSGNCFCQNKEIPCDDEDCWEFNPWAINKVDRDDLKTIVYPPIRHGPRKQDNDQETTKKMEIDKMEFKMNEKQEKLNKAQNFPWATEAGAPRIREWSNNETKEEDEREASLEDETENKDKTENEDSSEKENAEESKTNSTESDSDDSGNRKRRRFKKDFGLEKMFKEHVQLNNSASIIKMSKFNRNMSKLKNTNFVSGNNEDFSICKMKADLNRKHLPSPVNEICILQKLRKAAPPQTYEAQYLITNLTVTTLLPFKENNSRFKKNVREKRDLSLINSKIGGQDKPFLIRKTDLPLARIRSDISDLKPKVVKKQLKVQELLMPKRYANDNLNKDVNNMELKSDKLGKRSPDAAGYNYNSVIKGSRSNRKKVSLRTKSWIGISGSDMFADIKKTKA